MSRLKTNPLIVFQELDDEVEGVATSIFIFWHWLDGDYGIVLVLPGGFATERQSSSCRAIPPMLNLHIRKQEGCRIDREVGHDVGFFDVDVAGQEGGVCCYGFGGGDRGRRD